MLGYTRPNNDLHIFFEENEIERLLREKITGRYFNPQYPSRKCLLEAFINNDIDDGVKTSGQKKDEFMTYFLLEIRGPEYHRLKHKGSLELHQGFRHVCLTDASGELNFQDRIDFEQLKQWREQCQKEE